MSSLVDGKISAIDSRIIPSCPKGATLGRQLLSTATKQGAIAGGTDVLLQLNDMGGGIQDDFSATQAAGAVALGAGLSTAVEAARPVSRFVRDAFTAKIPPAQAAAPQVSELRNAMIVTRQPGFQNREQMDRASYWEDLNDLAPEVAAELERRLGVGRDRAYDYDAVMSLWPQVEQRLKAEGSTAYLDDVAADAQGRTRSWGEKIEIDGPDAMVFTP